jgi:ketol-acid reductoisomerase
MKIDFGGAKEDVVTRKEFPLSKARRALKDETVAVIGYGVQGPAQALNMRDNGIRVIVGQRSPRGASWKKALRDGWKPGETLFSIEEAARRGTVIQYLVSDAGQKAQWPVIRRQLQPGKALYFSHGFSIVYGRLTHVLPPQDVDVIMVAPKGSGTSVRRAFLAGSGIHASFAIHRDASGRARERCLALGTVIGSGFLFPTTFEKEVYSDLTGERGALMGGLAALMEAQYECLRRAGHAPSEAFNESVEELTQSLVRLVGEKGMGWMFANCSATAQRGALDWLPRFKRALAPVFNDLYRCVKDGKETEIVLRANGRPDYRARLAEELRRMERSEMWRTGAAVRALRPENLGQGK